MVNLKHNPQSTSHNNSYHKAYQKCMFLITVHWCIATHLCFFSHCISQTDTFFLSLNLTKCVLSQWISQHVYFHSIWQNDIAQTNFSYHNAFHKIFLIMMCIMYVMFLITVHKKQVMIWSVLLTQRFLSSCSTIFVYLKVSFSIGQWCSGTVRNLTLFDFTAIFGPIIWIILTKNSVFF